jgi:hypothetical protein
VRAMTFLAAPANAFWYFGFTDASGGGREDHG